MPTQSVLKFYRQMDGQADGQTDKQTRVKLYTPLEYTPFPSEQRYNLKQGYENVKLLMVMHHAP